MRVNEIKELHRPRFTRGQFNSGLEELQQCIEAVTAESLISWYRANGMESDKSISKAVNGLILQNLVGAGWEKDWSFCPSVRSNHATFVASKVFGDKHPLRFALDIASRHSNEALGYLVKGQLATKNKSPEKFQVDAHILLAYDEECLTWGRWNTAVYSFEKLMENTPLIEGSVSTPIWIIAVGKPTGLSVTTSLAGTLKLEKLSQ